MRDGWKNLFYKYEYKLIVQTRLKEGTRADTASPMTSERRPRRSNQSALFFLRLSSRAKPREHDHKRRVVHSSVHARGTAIERFRQFTIALRRVCLCSHAAARCARCARWSTCWSEMDQGVDCAPRIPRGLAPKEKEGARPKERGRSGEANVAQLQIPRSQRKSTREGHLLCGAEQQRLRRRRWRA